ncbi:DUF445 domain-containing protein [Sphingomonas flavalba]|uniref:DUF445 domain-containing protein n=1 Tax=Sphingomonas flavalba TaxID=2559804 RepID=UPI00109DE589|nr:DUF445 domain-containing protein [Sphingomonas flavalba]
MSFFARTRLDRLHTPQSYAGMRVTATGLLLAMAAVYLAARHFEPIHPAAGFVRAFAEAAMVGGLADWFAVTALFRHPLRLPIPHTAIIPRNKDRIGDTLALFLRDNFLTPSVVARRMRGVDVAGAAGRFLTAPTVGGEGRLRDGASRLVADILGALDQERLGGMVKGAIVQRIAAIDFAPILGQALSAAIKEDRHVPLLDGAIRWAGRALEANEHLIRAMIHERAGAVMRWTGLDETLANKIIDGLLRLLDEMSIDPAHPLRVRAEDGLNALADDLQSEERLRRRVADLRDALLDNPAMRHWIDGLWEQARAALLGAVNDPGSAMSGRLGEMAKQLGEALQQDERLRLTINRFVRRAAVGGAARYGDGIVTLVSDTIRGWDARTVTDRLEAAVGRDLQYIRVNGTLVGGLVGLTIHTLNHVG